MTSKLWVPEDVNAPEPPQVVQQEIPRRIAEPFRNIDISPEDVQKALGLASAFMAAELTDSQLVAFLTHPAVSNALMRYFATIMPQNITPALIGQDRNNIFNVVVRGIKEADTLKNVLAQTPGMPGRIPVTFDLREADKVLQLLKKALEEIPPPTFQFEMRETPIVGGEHFPEEELEHHVDSTDGDLVHPLGDSAGDQH